MANARVLRCLPAAADAMVVVPVPAAAAAVTIVTINAHAGGRAHGTHMRAGANAIGPGTGPHADRAHLHASANLRQGGAWGDEARGKK